MPQTFDKAATVTLVQPVTFDNPKNGPDGQPLKDEKGNPVTEKAVASEQIDSARPRRIAGRDQAARHQRRRLLQRRTRRIRSRIRRRSPNFLEMLAILLIPAALCYTFGRMIGDTRQGWALLAAMTIVFAALLAYHVRRGAEQAIRR